MRMFSVLVELKFGDRQAGGTDWPEVVKSLGPLKKPRLVKQVVIVLRNDHGIFEARGGSLEEAKDRLIQNLAEALEEDR